MDSNIFTEYNLEKIVKIFTTNKANVKIVIAREV